MKSKQPYLGLIPATLKFGEIVTWVLPPRDPATTSILYDKSPVPTIGPDGAGPIVTSKYALTDLA